MGNDPQGKPTQIQIQVDLDDQTAQGTYVNMARIFHNQTEFVLDALYLPPQSTRAKVAARLILSPTHARFLLSALEQNLRMYEQKFGAIKIPQGGGGNSEPGPILH